MTLGVMLGVVGCVLPLVGVWIFEVVEARTKAPRLPDVSMSIVVALLAAAIYWTALIVWLVLR
jgi:hypothetical protein